MPSSDLECCGQFVVCQPEGFFEHQALLDSFGLTDHLHEVLDFRVDIVEQLGGGDTSVLAVDCTAEVCGDRFEQVEIGHDDGADEVSAVAIDDCLFEEWVGCEQSFDDGWSDVFSGGCDEQVFFCDR